jgi:hypothetical protein
MMVREAVRTAEEFDAGLNEGDMGILVGDIIVVVAEDVASADDGTDGGDVIERAGDEVTNEDCDCD